MNWRAYYSDDTIRPAGPGLNFPRAGLVALECDGYTVPIPETSTGSCRACKHADIQHYPDGACRSCLDEALEFRAPGVKEPIPKVRRLERTSIGKASWTAGIIAVDDDIHILRRQSGWGTGVLDGEPVG